MRKRDGIYWYDEDAATDAAEFFPRHLIHIEGPLAGDRVALDPWQKDRVIHPLFGWKRPHTCAKPNVVIGTKLCLAPAAGGDGICEYGLRRYRELELFIPRKNTKTTLSMGIALILLCADDEMGAQVYLAAFDKDQAGIGYNIAATMVEHSKTLRRKLKVRRSKLRIAYPTTDSFLEAIPSQAAGAQGFNAHGVVYDEYHTAVDDELDDALDGGMAARRQPLLERATTSGRTIASPAGRLYLRAKDVIAGTREARPDELIVLYEAPEGADWHKRETWKVANPGFGRSVQPSFVDKQIRKADEEPSKRADILRYGLNIWPDYTEAELPLEKWDECAGSVNLKKLEGRSAFVGVGISSSLDMAAVALLFPSTEKGEPVRVVLEHFIPAATVAARERAQDAPPWREWISKGWLHLVDGEVLDYAQLEQLVQTNYGTRFEIQEIVVNPRGAAQFMSDLMRDEEPVVALTPSFRTMSPAWRELERLVTKKLLEHGGNAALRFQISKVRLRHGPNDEVAPDRDKSKTNIEGVIAMLAALNRAVVGSAEEEEGAWTAV